MRGNPQAAPGSRLLPVCRFPHGRPHHALTDIQLEMLRLDDPRIFGINVAPQRMLKMDTNTHGHCKTCFIYLGRNSWILLRLPWKDLAIIAPKTGEEPLVRCDLADCKKCLEIYTTLEHQRLRKERAREQEELMWARVWAESS